MNDRELDELLNTWEAQSPGENFRNGVRDRIQAANRRPRRPQWGALSMRWRLAGALAAMSLIAFMLVNPDAFSERVRPPYTVDSEINNYDSGNPGAVPPGSQTSRDYVPRMPSDARLLLTSYNDAGSEVILSWSSPNNDLGTVVEKLRLLFSNASDRFKRRFLLAPDEEAGAFAVVYPQRAGEGMIVGRRDDLLTSGCRTSHGDAKEVGHEVILNYSTTVIQQKFFGGKSMLTVWMAPELGCFALRATVHTQQLDGSWKLVSEKRALRVLKKTNG